MTKEYLLSQTLYGVGIMNYLIRKEFPEHRIFVRGDDCGENPDPVFADGSIISIEIEKIYTPGNKHPNRVAKFHYFDESLPDGDAIDLAHAYYLKRGEVMTTQELINKLAAEMFINEPDYNPYHPTALNTKQEKYQVPETPKMPPAPKFSFFRRPIRNTRPSREASPQDIFKYIVSDYAKYHTEHLRTITDSKLRSRYKAENLDYITPGGIFSSRKESELIKPSGYMVIDFDHIPDPKGLVLRLANEPHFETVLAFRSPSGDGVKWIVALPPNAMKPDGTPFTYGEFFTILSNYSRKVYGIDADPSGKDICRACFLPHDPEAFLNPFYLEENLEYEINRFLYGSAQ